MKSRFIAICGLVVALGAGSAFVGLAQTPPGGAPPASGRQGKQAKHREGHPEMQRALRALGNAKKALEAAGHDFHGHRTKAVQHVEEAMKEVRDGIASDKE